MPFTLDLTDPLRPTPFAAVVAAGVELRDGVRVVDPGEAEVFGAASRLGVPGGTGFLTVVDMLGVFSQMCSVCGQVLSRVFLRGTGTVARDSVSGVEREWSLGPNIVLELVFLFLPGLR